MIVADNTISGLKGIIGTFPIHLGMIITMFFWVPHDFNESGTYAGLNELWSYCFTLHVFLAGVTLLNNFVTHNTRLLANLLTIVGISAYVGLYLVIVVKLACNWTTYERIQNKQDSDQYKAILWYLIEVFMLVGYILAYQLLLFVRFFFKMRVHLEMAHAYFSVNTDFIEAESIVC